MTAGLALAFAAMVCFGLGDWTYRRAARAGVRPHHFLIGQACLFCPTVLAYAAATEHLTVGGPALWGNLAGLVLFLSFFLFARSLRGGPVSVYGPIFRLAFVVTVVLAVVVLDEPFGMARAAGLTAALVAVWLLLGGGRAASSSATIGRSLVDVTLATVLAGAGYFCHKLGLIGGAAPATMVAAQAMVFASLAVVTTAALDGTLRVPPTVWRHSLPAAVVLAAAFLLFVHALEIGQASVVVPVAQMGFVPAALLGILIGGEPVTLRKAAGLVTAVAALALLAWS